MKQFSHLQSRIDTFLTQFLDNQKSQSPTCSRLEGAIRYTLLAGGKRIRPLLVYATAESLNVEKNTVDYIAASIEMIHAYSLIHDDLPAMDNDELRRGKPTCHIQYDEATAILAGDALQAMAFEVLSHTPTESSVVVKLLNILAAACGLHGMAGGQSLDLQAESKSININQLQAIHSAKTGALLVACVNMVVCLCDQLDKKQIQAYHQFAEHFGLAFQIVDDILDVTGNTSKLGKPAGSDQQRHKSTYPSLLGLEKAHEKARYHISAAKRNLQKTSQENLALLTLTDYIQKRSH